MDDQYCLRSYLFDSLVLKNYGVEDLQPMAQSYCVSMAQRFYYSIMSDEELNVMLQGMFPTRLENYDPNRFFRSPIPAGRRWSCLDSSKRVYVGNYFMACISLSNYETNFLMAF